LVLNFGGTDRIISQFRIRYREILDFDGRNDAVAEARRTDCANMTNANLAGTGRRSGIEHDILAVDRVLARHIYDATTDCRLNNNGAVLREFSINAKCETSRYTIRCDWNNGLDTDSRAICSSDIIDGLNQNTVGVVNCELQRLNADENIGAS
jgi:hypothetical protein